jgi:acyl-CoA synthetase (AMP-forming)/AMP-acid ligase II
MNRILQKFICSTEVFGDRTALADGRETLTYSELKVKVDGFCAAARALMPDGARRVAVYMQNSSDYVACYFGLIAAGCIPFLIDRSSNRVELSAIQKSCGLDHFAMEVSGANKFPLPGSRVIGPLGGNVVLVSTSSEIIELPLTLNDTSVCRFTSGSGGLPKCLEFSDDAVISAAETWVEGTGLGQQDRIFCIAALSNGLAFNTSLLSTFLVGAELHLYTGIVMASRILDALVERRVTRFVGFPVIYRHLSSLDLIRHPTPSFLNLAISSSAVLNPEVRVKFFDRFGLDISDYYGIAETGPVTFETDSSLRKGIGQALPGVELRIGSAEEEFSGLVQVKTKYLASRYLNHPGLFESKLTQDGFYVSDDAGELIDGRLYIRGNIGKVANIGGRNVQLSEIRNFLAGIEGVAEAELFVDQDSADRDILHAVIVPGRGLTRKDVVVACRQNLAGFKVPSRITFVNELPRSGVGKITLSALRQIVKQQESSLQASFQED